MDTLTIVPAKGRLQVERGWLLMWASEKGGEAIHSWHVYRTKKLADAARVQILEEEAERGELRKSADVTLTKRAFHVMADAIKDNTPVDITKTVLDLPKFGYVDANGRPTALGIQQTVRSAYHRMLQTEREYLVLKAWDNFPEVMLKLSYT